MCPAERLQFCGQSHERVLFTKELWVWFIKCPVVSRQGMNSVYILLIFTATYLSNQYTFFLLPKFLASWFALPKVPTDPKHVSLSSWCLQFSFTLEYVYFYSLYYQKSKLDGRNLIPSSLKALFIYILFKEIFWSEVNHHSHSIAHSILLKGTTGYHVHHDHTLYHPSSDIQQLVFRSWMMKN